MRDIDSNGLFICRMQGRIFEQSAKRFECNSDIFIKRFLHSEVASRMDGAGFVFEACEVINVLDEFEKEHSNLTYGSVKYSEDELYWIGYIYRYWAYTMERSSRQVYRMIKPDELRALYFPYHSLDPKQCIERIMEAKEIALVDDSASGVGISTPAPKENTSMDDIARGVEILRKIRQQSQNGE